jgi:hypothetical protein
MAVVDEVYSFAANWPHIGDCLVMTSRRHPMGQPQRQRLS